MQDDAKPVAWMYSHPEPSADVVERACDAFMSKITVDGNGGIEFLEEGIIAAIQATPAEPVQDLHELPQAERIKALEAENERLREALKRCATIVDRNLYRQHEKVEDVPKIARQALGEG